MKRPLSPFASRPGQLLLATSLILGLSSARAEKPASEDDESSGTATATGTARVIVVTGDGDGDGQDGVQPRVWQFVDRQAQERASAAQMSKRAWLGVALAEVDGSVREYLELPLGFGVMVEHVSEGSPAEKAGLQARDILMRFDDQRLTTPQHLQVLVATYKKGDSVELGIIRKGRDQELKVTLGEAELPPLTMGAGPAAEDQGTPSTEMTLSPVTLQVMPSPIGGEESAAVDQSEVQKRIAEYREQMQEWMKQDAATRGPAPKLEISAARMAPRDVDARQAFSRVPAAEPSTEGGDSAPGSGASVRVTGGGSGVSVTGGRSITIGPGASIVASGNGGGVVRINNDQGTVTVTSKDGEAVIALTDRDGKVIYSGPYERRDGFVDDLPKKARDLLKRMNLNNLHMLNIQVATPASEAGPEDAPESEDAAEKGKPGGKR